MAKAIGVVVLGTALAGSSLAEVPPVLVDAQQSGINGSGTGAQLGLPFGQSYTAGSMSPVYGIALAAVDGASLHDLNFFLWRTDLAGSSLLGSPLASGSITAGQIAAFAPTDGAVTPIWFLAFFNQPYAQTVGEKLAFTIEGGESMNFYFANGSSYTGGRLLGDGSKDLTFATVVPEPGVLALLGAAGIGSLSLGRKGVRAVRSGRGSEIA